MPENIFKEFRQTGRITLKGKTAPFRRVGHSASNWFSRRRGDLTPDIGTPLNLAENAATATGLVGIGAGIAAMAGSTAAFVVAVGGPQVAITAGVISLVALAKGAYSNRESAHEKLIPYVWSLIDPGPPRIDIFNNTTAFEEASSAAAYLLKEAESQYSEMGNKLQVAENNFSRFWIEYTKVINILLTPQQGGIWPGEGIMRDYDHLTPSKKGFADPIMLKNHEKCNNAKVKSDEMWERGIKQGGAVFEYIRRLVHIGNYLQCPAILSAATFNKLQANSVINPGDMLGTWRGATAYRDKCQNISDIIHDKNSNYESWERFIQRHNLDR